MLSALKQTQWAIRKNYPGPRVGGAVPGRVMRALRGGVSGVERPDEEKDLGPAS